jgi:hypothetical protein
VVRLEPGAAPVHEPRPRGIFEFVEGVIGWHNRVVGYAFILVTDSYPPFSLSQREPPPPAPERPGQAQA